MQQAINDALESTLINDVHNIFNAQRVAFVIYYSSENELRVREMTDIHNFMARFKTEYEVKWGYGYDESLGDKIKITILVTGFGLNSIVLSPEQLQELSAERSAEREQENKEIKDIYGAYMDFDGELSGFSKAEPVVLSLDELDDNALIVLLEDNPAYNRKPEVVDRFRQGKSKKEKTYSEENISDKTDSGRRQVIKFE